MGEHIAQTWGWDERFQREFHNNDYDPAQTQIIVESGQDVGWMLVSEDDTGFRLRELYIGPDHQSGGVGSELIRMLLRQAERKSKPVTLAVLKVNLRARQLYERLEFRIVGESETHYIMSTGGPTSR